MLRVLLEFLFIAVGAFVVGVIFFCVINAAHGAETPRCLRGDYPLMQLQAFACARGHLRPSHIYLSPQDYWRLRGEFEQCFGRKLIPGQVIKLCGVPVFPRPVANPREATT